MTNKETNQTDQVKDGLMARAGFALADWSEKWFPDAYVFAVIAVVLVGVAAILMGRTPAQIGVDFGSHFWDLIPFAMQMAFVVITGFVVATAKPVHKFIVKLATIPKTPKGAFLTPDVVDIFRSYPWPGNVRELENAVEHALIMSSTRVILPEHLPLSITMEEVEEGTVVAGNSYFQSLREVLSETEKRHIAEAIERTGGNHTHAAKLLQISRRALLYKIQEHNLS